MQNYRAAAEDFKVTCKQGWAAMPGLVALAEAAATRVDADVAAGAHVLPLPGDVFAALKTTSPEEVRAVILGQDPYPTAGNAHGFAFSVPPGRPIPASLKNIFRSLTEDFGQPAPASGDLRVWASCGVLLLNTILTVREGEPHSHKAFGWRNFSERLVSELAANHNHIVFLLWGGPAQAYARFINSSRHGVITATHPSPLNAKKGGVHPFVEAHPFQRANAYLVQHGLQPIDWRL